MLEIIEEWFGQGPSIPIIAVDIFFAAIGFYAALKIKNKKIIIYIMLTLLFAYFIASVAAQQTNFLVAIIAVFAGAAIVLIFVGMAIGLAYRALKK